MATNPCCCIALRTGAFIIGILEIVLSSIYLIFAVIALATAGLLESAIKEGKTDLPLDSKDFSSMNTVLIIATVSSVLEIILASMLIHGIRMERSGLLQVWLVLKTIGLVLDFVVILVTGWFLFLFDCLISLYFITVIYYLWVEFRATESGRSGQVSYTPKA